MSCFLLDWFPGWANSGGYSVQPNDDGMSQQNCVELRNAFRYPSKGEGVTDTFYWNDRDCLLRNPFVCQRLKPGGKEDHLLLDSHVEINRDCLLQLMFRYFFISNQIEIKLQDQQREQIPTRSIPY